MTKQGDSTETRREFLARMVKAGISIGAASALAAIYFDGRGPGQGSDEPVVRLPDFSVRPQIGKHMSIVKGVDRTNTCRKAVELLGGISRFVAPDDTVVIKPNVAFASPPMLGATTNPELVTEVAGLCYAAGAKKVIVTDNPINDPESCFQISQIGRAATEAGAKVVLPRKTLFSNTTVKDAKLIRNWPIYFGPLDKVDKLIGIAPVKDHHRSGASMSMKNWYGLLGGRRNVFHQDINTIIAELALMVRPTLVILDGTESMVTNGPTGGSISDLKQTNTMIASTDMVAADSFGATLLGLKVSDLAYLTKAQQFGAGTTNYESLRPILATVS